MVLVPGVAMADSPPSNRTPAFDEFNTESALSRYGQRTGSVLMIDQAVKLALKNNRGILNAELGVEKATDGLDAMKTKRLPQLKVGVFESYHITDEAFTLSEGEIGEYPLPTPPGGEIDIPPSALEIATVDDFTTLVTASVALPLSQQYPIGLGIQQHQLAENMADQQLRSKRQSTVKRVKDLYYSILRTEASLAATLANVEYLDALAENVARNVEQQRVLLSDSLSTQTEVARARQRAMSEEDSIASQHEQMNLLLGRDIETPFWLSLVPDPEDFSVDPLQAERTALAQRPSVQMAKLKEQHAKLDVKIKKWEYIPDLSIEVRYTSQFGSKFIPENLASVGLFASWDVWDWGRRSHEISAKNVELRQAKIQIREAEARVRIDVNNKIRSLRQAEARVPISRLAADAAEEKLRVARNKYAEQSILIDDLLRASSDLASARRDVEDAKLGVWMSWTDLLKAMGEE